MDNLVVRHGFPTDTLATPEQQVLVHPITGVVAENRRDLKIIYPESKTSAYRLGVSTHKLFTKAISELKTGSTCVRFPIKDYCNLVGYPTRTKGQTTNAYNHIRMDLKKLHNITISWTNPADSKEFKDISMVCEVGIQSGYIELEFSPSFAKWLLEQPIVTVCEPLMKIDGRNKNAYSIGYKILTHRSINSRRTNKNRLKVETLLKVTNLPSYKQVLADGGSWQHRIKRPFEKALNVLKKAGVINGWAYKQDGNQEKEYYSFLKTTVIFQ